jgi:hypothetical protein
MTEDETPDSLEDSADLEDDGVLDGAETLDGDVRDDPLDQGIDAPEGWSAGERFGTTLDEERAGESLDQLLAEEEPDTAMSAGDDWVGTDRSDLPAGRLVADDEGAGPDEEPELVARDVGVDTGGPTAEEAAVHVSNDDDRDYGSAG